MRENAETKWYHNPQEKSEELEPLQRAEEGDK